MTRWRGRSPEDRDVDGPGGSREAAFEAFVEQTSRELGRLAFLMLGDRDAADDVAADALLAAWRRWGEVGVGDYPLAYARRVVINTATSRARRLDRERRGLVLFQREAMDEAAGADAAVVVDVRSALVRLPPGRRACVVLRYAFDLHEREVAVLLGVSVGTVKSQTAKGAGQLRQWLGEPGEMAGGGIGSDAGWRDTE